MFPVKVVVKIISGSPVSKAIVSAEAAITEKIYKNLV